MKRYLPLAALLAASLVIPLWVHSPYALHIFILLFIAVATGESWNVITPDMPEPTKFEPGTG